MSITTAPTSTWSDVTDLLAAKLPGFESRPEQDGLALAIEKALTEGTHLLGQAGCGCIQGDAEIIVNRGGNARRMTLRHLVTAFNGGRNPGQQKYWDRTIPTYVQREADGVVRLGRVLHAWHSGVKTTYTVTTETGRTLRATDEHPFLTERGWLRLDELKVDDELHVRGEQAVGQARQPKPVYRRICVLPHPYRNGKTVPEHRLVAEADRNGLSYDAFLDQVRTGDTEGLEFLDPDVWAVHHKNHDTLNNALSNLQVLTHEEHHRLHAAEGKTNSVLYKIVTERVESIERFGEEDTYDIEVADDPHNFLVNGIVVHNTGKSFAYLAGAVAHAKATGRPVIVSTATKALQDQIADKDAPFLAEVLHPLFGDIKVVLVKGRSNYVCQDKLHGDAAEDVPNIAAIREELDSVEGHTGDLDTFITPIAPEHRLKLITTGDECPGKRECRFGDVCYAEGARNRAQDAHVVVTNHAMMMRDVMVQQATDGIASLLPTPSAYVLDEGHEFEEYARSALGNDITDRALVRFADDVSSFLVDANAGDPLRAASRETFELLTALLDEIKKDQLALEDDEALLPVSEKLLVVLQAVRSLDERVKNHRPATEDEAMSRKRLRRRAENLVAKVEMVLLAEDTELVRWAERETKRFQGKTTVTVKLAFQPIELADLLADLIWNDTPAVLVSATLALGSDFSFIADSLGIGDYTGFDAGSPFDYAKQSALYIPNPQTYPEPTAAKREEWSARTHAEIGELVAANGGRALCLFTSRREMDAAFAALSPRLRKMGLTTLRQGDGPLPALVARKKAEPTSVLFGLRSLMTGVDFQGDAVTLVTIDKLPFPVPDDIVFAARSRLIDARSNGVWKRKAFSKLSVPTMALTLFQAHGRAIRTKADHALIAIFDPRLRSKGYGGDIVRALPRSLNIDSLGNAEEYLRDLTERRDG
jgi:ATP-dependent DNA helicase DinG